MRIEVKPVIDHTVRGLCIKPYPNHKKGCPNFDKKDGCPPAASLFENIADLSSPVYIIFTRFEIGKHIDKMKRRHPMWTDRQLSCCLYWQETARKNLKIAIDTDDQLIDLRIGGYKINTCPEAMGINITETMKQIGINLEWPPRYMAYKIAIAYMPTNQEDKGE